MTSPQLSTVSKWMNSRDSLSRDPLSKHEPLCRSEMKLQLAVLFNALD
jgi:hypothetical protein